MPGFLLLKSVFLFRLWHIPFNEIIVKPYGSRFNPLEPFMNDRHGIRNIQKGAWLIFCQDFLDLEIVFFSLLLIKGVPPF